MMNITAIRVLILLILSITISGCGLQDDCLQADDFGFANFTVSARYTKKEMNYQVNEEQVSPWRSSGYRVNGKPLVMLVKGWTPGLDRNSQSELSAWCAHYGQQGNEHTLSKFCERLQDCHFPDGIMCSKGRNSRVDNFPCLFRNGIGLYGLIADKGTDPNASLSSQADPQGLNFHLGEKTDGYEMLDIDKNGNMRKAGGMVYNYTDSSGSQDQLKQKYQDGELYFKILDRFYDDNSGQYLVSIKSGITTLAADPITAVTNLVKKYLFGSAPSSQISDSEIKSGDYTDQKYGLIRNIYLNIVKNPGYKMAVTGMLSLFIMWTALQYLAGNIRITQTELIVRVLKVATIATLLQSEKSWTFFNDYIFVWFTDGMGQILQMVMDAGATGSGSSNILAMMLAPQTMAKISSLLFVDWRGFIYIILFIIALYYVALMFFKASVIYLTALMAVGMIITMAPIFICFVLFGITKSLFENWLKQLISYSIQPIILFTGIVFISMILREEMYQTVGFKVCKKSFPTMNNEGAAVLSDATQEAFGFSMGNSLFYWWFPQPMKGSQFSRTLVNIPIPIDHYEGDNNIVGADQNNGAFCEAYACVGQRYADLPYLDPQKDAGRIQQFWNGQFVQFDRLLLIFVAIYLLDKFNGLTVSMAKFITGTSGNLTDISNVAGNAVDHARANASWVGGKVKGRLANTKVGRAAIAIREAASQKLETLKQKPSQWVDKIRVANLRKEAISKNPNKAVIAEVKKASGLDYKDIKQGAIGDYRSALKTELKKIDPTLTEKQANKIASKMTHKNFKELENEFAKAKFGKDFNKLDEVQKAEVQAITNNSKHKMPTKNLKKLQDKTAKEKFGKEFNKLNAAQKAEIQAIANSMDKGKSLKELANDADYSRKYAEAYVDAYQALSNRGVGLIGKRSSTIRSLQELNHKIDTKAALKEAKRRQVGEKIYAGYEGLKHDAFKKLTGDSRNPIIQGLGNTYAGGAWNTIDTNPKAENYRMQTYKEKLDERDKSLKYQSIVKKIENLSEARGESVISPEYIARAKVGGDSNLETYRNLAKEQAKQQVFQELTAGEDPALKGELFMREYAKDSEMVRMIDKAEEIRAHMFKEDDFISRQEHHETVYELAKDNIIEVKDTLEYHFDRGNIPAEEMPKLLEKYHQEMGIDPVHSREEVQKLEKSMEEFVSSQHVLQEIDQRKQVISAEIDKHITKVNDYRKQADMQEYVPPKRPVVIRSTRKIEDLRRR